MDIVLICHGEEEKNSKKTKEVYTSKTRPLSKEGKCEVCQRKGTLTLLGLQPEVYLTSEYKSVNETAQLLASNSKKDCSSVEVENLKSHLVFHIDALKPLDQSQLTIKEILETIITEAAGAHVDLSLKNTVVLVGHRPTLNLILTRLISQRVRRLDLSEAVWVQAPSLLEFRRGEGKIYCRIPVADYREGELRPKVQSKMTVSTFLAGFAFTVLAGLLTVPGANFTPLLIIAIWFLTAAVALFIATVYIYDQLAMPEGFWLYDSDGRRQIVFWRIRISESWRGKHFKDDRRERGPLYAYMVWTWRWIFTFGVFCGIVGFISMLLNTGRIEVIAVGIVVLVAMVLFYWFFAQPLLSTD